MLKITKLKPPEPSGWTLEELQGIHTALAEAPYGIRVKLPDTSFRLGMLGRTPGALAEQLGDGYLVEPGPKGIHGPYQWVEIRTVAEPAAGVEEVDP
jgi:hypothetical protein